MDPAHEDTRQGEASAREDEGMVSEGFSCASSESSQDEHGAIEQDGIPSTPSSSPSDGSAAFTRKDEDSGPADLRLPTDRELQAYQEFLAQWISHRRQMVQEAKKYMKENGIENVDVKMPRLDVRVLPPLIQEEDASQPKPATSDVNLPSRCRN